ncbi:MAG: G3E family GTPase [Cellvibrionaceae bacterium]|jgi:G3E family GTPase
MKTQAALSLLLISALTSLHSIAADKHVHGEAELFVAIESNQILIEMESPAANILGFEHEPNTSQQKAILKSSVNTLQDYRKLIEIEGGGCNQVDVFVESPFTINTTTSSKNDHHDHDKPKPHKHEHEETSRETHSAFHVGYTLECKDSSEVKTLTLNVFKAFPKVKTMQVNWASTRGQGTQKVSAKKVTVKLN